CWIDSTKATLFVKYYHQTKRITTRKACAWLVILCPAVACSPSTSIAEDGQSKSASRSLNVYSDISKDEALASSFSLVRGRTYLNKASSQWWKAKACVSCHTNGLHLLAESLLEPQSEAVKKSQQRFRQFLNENIPAPGEDAPTAHLTSSLVAATAFLAMSESRTDGELHADTRRALDHVWTLQSNEGHWPDGLKCDWPPYEVDDHFHVTLMAV